MALGFGFNKAKVLASAEKNVQQGKLQNAIADYEKVLKEDPKDLTVLNTVGDICARVGQVDQAAAYFKKVGDAYATDGFTVKAIAMYKKLTKIAPGVSDTLQRLAELYTVQGLYNDARAQYVQVADLCLKAGNNDGAAKTLQKILELDPENTNMQGKLADLYMKMGKRDEARAIYFNAAQSLYAKQAMDAADEALGRVLAIEPKNMDALLLRGTIAAESGDGLRAHEYLQQINDIDKRPDALRSLLRAELLVWDMEEGERTAIKLLTVHSDVTGIIWYADALLNSGKYEDGIKFYEKFADRVLPAHSAAITKSMSAVIGKVKESSAALEGLRNLFQRAGDATHDNELIELLAHAYVLEGKLAKARDLYKILSEIEPENPLHLQNFKQVVAKLGEDAATAPLSTQQAQQAVMMDELDHEHHVPVIDMQYSADVLAAVRSALTDSELFDSYNLPLKAIPPLEGALAKAPRDPQIHVRLASLYGKVRRFQDGCSSAKLVQELYAQHGFAEDSQKYAELAQQYQQKASAPAVTGPPVIAEEPGFTAADFGFADDTPMQSVAPIPPPAPVEGFTASSAAHVEVPPHPNEAFGASAWDEPATPAAAGAAPAAPEFGMAPAEAAPVVQAPPTEFGMAPAEEEPAAPVADFGVAAVEDTAPVAQAPPVEFGMAPTEAEPPAALAAAPAETVHHEEWESMLHVEEAPASVPPSATPSAGPQVDTAALAEEIRFYLSQKMWTEAEAGLTKFAEADSGSTELGALRAQFDAARAAASQPAPAAEASVAEFVFESTAAAVEPEPVPTASAPTPIEPAPLAPSVAMPAPPPPPAAPEVIAPSMVSPVPPTPVAPVIAASAAPVPAPAAAEADDPLGGLISDLEDVLGDLGVPEPPPKTAPAPVARAAAASATPAPLAPVPDVPIVEHHEATSILSDLFDEFKEDVEETAGEVEDPNTHYSLGVAFREMGLLDEAIGELQKVCHAIEKGAEFDQKVQAYTWLAQCLIDKGAPEAAIRWYEKALKLPGLSEDSRLAVFYDMGNAYEAGGDRKNAYVKFMEVYSSNIDYRDVAERVKALK